MRLHGISAEPGTFMGTIEREGVKLGLIVDDWQEDHPNRPLRLRLARRGEIDQGNMPDPRSVAEHEALPLIQTPYGPARAFGLRPYKREMARQGYVSRIRDEKKIKIARRRINHELKHLYQLRGELDRCDCSTIDSR